MCSSGFSTFCSQYNNVETEIKGCLHIILDCNALFRCSSYVGYLGYSQKVTLANSCMEHGTVVHEIGT